MSKMNIIKNIIGRKEILICPLCQKNMKLVNNSLICINNHTFDISKKGKISLIKTSKIKADRIYNEVLFKNRSEFIRNHFYDDMHKIVADILCCKHSNIIVDLGCGDSTHDLMIINRIIKENSSALIYGIDIAKDAINISCVNTSKNFLPILSDIHNLPFKNKSIDAIINILSPINETEVKRILKDNGIIIKVTPKKEYLQELRKIMNLNEYENEQILEKNLENKYKIIKKIEIIKKFDLTNSQFKNLIYMTPMTNNKIVDKEISKITIALNIYVLKV